MSQRRSPIIVLSAVAIGIAFMLTGCFPTAAKPTTTPSAAGPATTPATTAPTATPTPTVTTPIAPATASAAGCAATTATMPAGAVTHKTIDVDGDGRADTEWVSDSPSLRFGVTTASGATFSYALSSASPAQREGFIARLNDHRIVSIVDDNRSAYIHFFVNCGWVKTLHPNGTQYTLDFGDFAGTGTGVGCSLGYVESFQATNTSTGYTVKETPVDLNATGSIGNPGATTTVVKNASSSDPRVGTAQAISCGSVTVASGGVTLGE